MTTYLLGLSTQAALKLHPGQVNAVTLPLLVRFDQLTQPPAPVRDEYGNVLSEVCSVACRLG